MGLFRHLADDAQPPWTETKTTVPDIHRARIREAWEAYRARIPRGYTASGIYGFLQTMGDLGTMVDDYEDKIAKIDKEMTARRVQRGE